MRNLLFGCFLFLVTCSAFAAEPSFFTLHSVAKAPSSSTKEYRFQYRNNPPEILHLEMPALLESSAIKSATVQVGQQGSPEILISFTEEGAKRFGEITASHIGKQIAIVLGGRVQTAPVVNDAIPGGSAIITGDFTETEAAELAKKLSLAPAR